MNDKKFKNFIKKRDNTIIECWETHSIEPLEDFIKENKDLIANETIENWNKAVFNVKLLTLCNMTLGITNPKVMEYQDKALELAKEIKESNIDKEVKTFKKLHFDYKPKEVILVKNLKPKYNWLEVVIKDDKSYMEIPYYKAVELERVIKDYSNRQVLSIKDYEDTKTTSIVITDKDKQ